MGEYTPQIRFKGFTDDWEERKFSKLAAVRRGLTYKPSDVQKHGIRVLRSSNITEDTFLIKPDDVFVNEGAVKIEKIKNGDILITSANGSSRLVGKHALIKGVQNDAVHGGFMLVAKAEKPAFVNAAMSAPWYSKFINIYVSGGNGTIGNLSKSDLEDQKVFVPSETEQNKIGLFFTQLDNTIALHQRQLNLLKEQKAGFLQKMFPQKGETVPKLRFDGFDGDWEKRKLGDFIDVNSGKDYKHLNSGSIPVYGTGGYMLSVDRALSDIDAIGIGRKGTIDKPYFLKAPFWTVDTLFYAVPKQNIDLQFSLSIFKKINWKKFDESTGVPSLSKTVINSVSVSVPSYEEQAKIGAFFKSLDTTITLQQRKLDLLKEQKKALLQKMFV